MQECIRHGCIAYINVKNNIEKYLVYAHRRLETPQIISMYAMAWVRLHGHIIISAIHCSKYIPVHDVYTKHYIITN